MAVTGFEQITVSTASLSLASIPDDARSCTIQPNNAAIRIRIDGSAPTTTVGTIVADGNTATISGREAVAGLRMIRDDAVDAIVEVAYTPLLLRV